MRKFLLFVALASFAVRPAGAADNAAAVIVNLGLVGTWASYCTGGADRTQPGLRIVFAAPPDSAPIYTTVSSDGHVATTVRSEVLEAAPAGADQIKLRLRIIGGDRDGGPLPDSMTNTFEQVIQKTKDTIRLAGVDDRFIQKCPD